MLVPQINFITNNIFLGGLGESELASAGITGVYYLIFAVIGNGLNNGLQALIARRAGQGLPKEIGRLFFHGVWVALVIAGFGIAITYSFAPMVLRSIIHNPVIADQVVDFLMIRIWGLPFLYLYVMRNALLVGVNQTKFLVWGTLAEALVNVVFDYGFIYGKFGLPEIGFNGAAYASIIAEASGLIVIYSIIRIKGLHRMFSFFENVKLEGAVFKLILIQSAPLIAQYAISIASWEYFYLLIDKTRTLLFKKDNKFAGSHDGKYTDTNKENEKYLLTQSKDYISRFPLAFNSLLDGEILSVQEFHFPLT